MEMIVQVLGSLFHPLALGVNIFGVVLGIIFGAMPGLNGVVGVALLLPLTYGLSPANGLMMLGGLYMGATYGGSISAILLNCPGTGEAACTALNGNPLARQGRAMEALSYSALSSGIGGMFGTLVMLFFTPVLAKMALKFGPPELFLVCLAGLAVVGSLMDKSMAKGFFAVGVGLVLSMVGMDTMSSNYRFTFGSADLQAGLNLIPVSVGLPCHCGNAGSDEPERRKRRNLLGTQAVQRPRSVCRMPEPLVGDSQIVRHRNNHRHSAGHGRRDCVFHCLWRGQANLEGGGAVRRRAASTALSRRKARTTRRSAVRLCR